MASRRLRAYETPEIVMLFGPAEDCERAKVYAVDANEQNFDRLARELAGTA